MDGGLGLLLSCVCVCVRGRDEVWCNTLERRNLNRQPEGYSYVNLAFRETVGSVVPGFSPTRRAGSA